MALLASGTGAPNPWFSLAYLRAHAEEVVVLTRQHIALTVWAVVAGLVIAVPLALLARRYPAARTGILAATGAIYTIPSLALFAILLPFTGLTPSTVLIGLTAYTLVILTRNVLVGLDGVPAEVRDAALGMGYGRLRLLARVDLPLALPAVIAGVRIATVSTIALVTVGAVVGNGGLGQLILRGLNDNFYRAEIMTGCVLCVLLAIVADLLLLGLQWVLTPWTHGRRSA